MIEYIQRFSALQRDEIAEIGQSADRLMIWSSVSVLFNEPKLLKYFVKLLYDGAGGVCFSALQRAEIAEIEKTKLGISTEIGFSALQRAEIAEILFSKLFPRKQN